MTTLKGQLQNMKPPATSYEGQLNRRDKRSLVAGDSHGAQHTMPDNTESVRPHLAHECANSTRGRPNYLPHLLEDASRPQGDGNEQDTFYNSPINPIARNVFHPTWVTYDLEQGGNSFRDLLETPYEGELFSVMDTPNYKPWAFRILFMSILLFLILVSLGFVELAVNMLPGGMKDTSPLYSIYNSTAPGSPTNPTHVEVTKAIDDHEGARGEFVHRLPDDQENNSSRTITQNTSISTIPSIDPISFVPPNIFSNTRTWTPGSLWTTCSLGYLTSRVTAAPRNIRKSYIIHLPMEYCNIRYLIFTQVMDSLIAAE